MAGNTLDESNHAQVAHWRHCAMPRRATAVLNVGLAIAAAVGSAAEVELVNGLVFNGSVSGNVEHSAYDHMSQGSGSWTVSVGLAAGPSLVFYNQQVRRVMKTPDAAPILITPEDTPVETFVTPGEAPYRPGKPILPFGWHGDGSGIYPDAEVPQDFRPLWRVRLRAWSLSSPVIAGDRIFVLDQPHRLLCFDRHRGTLLWQRHNPSHLNRDDLGMPSGRWTMQHFRLTCPTPVTDGRRIYAQFGNGVVACYDLDGMFQWSRQLHFSVHFRGGTANSPALLDGVLVVGGYSKDRPREAMMGLDAATGVTLWDFGNDGYRGAKGWPVDALRCVGAYGSHQVITLNGKRAVMNATGLIVDAAGSVLCAIQQGAPCPTPAWLDGVAFMLGKTDNKVLFQAFRPIPGCTFPTQDVVTDGVAYRFTLGAPSPSFETLWSSPEICGLRTPVAFGGIVYVPCGDRLVALDATDGRTLGSTKIVSEGEDNYGGPIMAKDRIVMIDGDKIHIIRTGRDMAEERTLDTAFDLDGYTKFVHPIFDGNRWYFRDRYYLWCLASGPAPADAASPAQVAANLRGVLTKNRDENQPALFRYVAKNLPTADRTAFLMEIAKSNHQMHGQAIRQAAEIRPAVVGLGDWMIERAKAGDGECMQYLGAALGVEPAAVLLMDMLTRPALVRDAAVALAHLKKHETQAVTALVKHLASIIADSGEVHRTLGAMDAFVGHGEATVRQTLVASLIALLNHEKADPGMKNGAIGRLGRLKQDAAPALNALRQAATDKALAEAAIAAIEAIETIEAAPDGANAK